MKLIRIASAAVVLLAVSTLRAEPPATQPSVWPGGPVSDAASLEMRATNEFNASKWQTALPLLKKLAIEEKADPDRVAQIEEKIRVCERNLKAAAAQAAAPPAAADAMPTAADKRTPHAAPKAGETRELTIKELGNFDYDSEKGGNIPDDVKKLKGLTIRLHGFMIPMDQASTISQFALVPSLFSCCFGQPPQVQHTIIVHAPAGKGVSYYPDEIVVQGKLTVDEKKDDGFIVSVFEIECESVKPAAK